MPSGKELTVPLPLPFFVTVRAHVVGVLGVVEVVGVVGASNVAVRLVLACTTKAQFPVPIQGPLHPAKVEPVSGVAARATLVPLAILALQALPHVMAVGLEATVPLPVPLLVTATE
jgi:hypothetical protein